MIDLAILHRDGEISGANAPWAPVSEEEREEMKDTDPTPPAGVLCAFVMDRNDEWLIDHTATHFGFPVVFEAENPSWCGVGKYTSEPPCGCCPPEVMHLNEVGVEEILRENIVEIRGVVGASFADILSRCFEYDLYYPEYRDKLSDSELVEYALPYEMGTRVRSDHLGVVRRFIVDLMHGGVDKINEL